MPLWSKDPSTEPKPGGSRPLVKLFVLLMILSFYLLGGLALLLRSRLGPLEPEPASAATTIAFPAAATAPVIIPTATLTLTPTPFPTLTPTSTLYPTLTPSP